MKNSQKKNHDYYMIKRSAKILFPGFKIYTVISKITAFVSKNV